MFLGLASIQSEEGSESRAGLVATVLTDQGPRALGQRPAWNMQEMEAFPTFPLSSTTCSPACTKPLFHQSVWLSGRTAHSARPAVTGPAFGSPCASGSSRILDA